MDPKNEFYRLLVLLEKVKDISHARMREILSYLQFPKTTTMCFMYEANCSD